MCPTKKEEDDLDGFHRKQLRRVLNVKYPAIMKNKTVYRLTGEEVLSVTLLRNRWKLFGHVLRMNKRTPACYRSMIHYFSHSNAPKFRGRPRMNLPRKLDEDLGRYSVGALQLRSLDDLHMLEMVAHARKDWKNLVKEMCVAAKAAKEI